MEKPDHIYALESLGFDFKSSGNQYQTECPSCGKSKLFFAADKELWDCKVCSENGNLTTFLRRFYQECLDDTSSEDRQVLASHRSLPPGIIKYHKLALNRWTGDWLIPIHNLNKELTGMYRYTIDATTPRVMPLKGSSQAIFNLNHISKMKTKTLIITEGPWDLLTIDHLIKTIGLSRDYDVISVPGAGTFKQDWLFLLKDRASVWCLFDNDDAGKKGRERIIKMIREQGIAPHEFQYMVWGNVESGYDVRDLYLDSEDEQAAFATIKNQVSPIPLEVASENFVESEECTSVEELLQIMKDNNFLVTDTYEQSLKIALAVTMSVFLPQEMLWMHFIGPPSSGKSTLASIISADDSMSFKISKMTGLVSGFKQGNKDFGLLPLLQDKSLVVKDFTAALKMPRSQQDTIFGELRDVYDGDAAFFYRNGKSFMYDQINFSMLTFVTQIIYQESQNRSELGERFLNCRVVDRGESSRHQARLSRQRFLDNLKPDDDENSISIMKVKAKAKGLIEFLKETVRERFAQIEDDEEIGELIIDLAEFTESVRSNVAREKDGDISYRAEVGHSSRMTIQFQKLAVSLAAVLDKPKIDLEILRLVKKVAWDTADGFGFEIVNKLYEYKNGATLSFLEKNCNIPMTTLKRRIENLKEFEIVRQSSISNGSSQGRNAFIFNLHPRIQTLLERLHDAESPKNTQVKRGKRPAKNRPKHPQQNKRT